MQPWLQSHSEQTVNEDMLILNNLYCRSNPRLKGVFDGNVPGEKKKVNAELK